MNKMAIACIFAMIILSSPVLAADIYQYSASVEINSDAHYELSMLLINYTSNSFSFVIPGTPYDMIINSSVPCAQKDSTWGKQITCDTSRISERIDLGVSYNTENKVSKKGSYYIFTDSFVMPMDVEKFVLKVKLPEASGLIQEDDAFSPAGALLGSDGRRSFVYWTKENMAQSESFDVSVAYEDIGILGYSLLETVMVVIITIVVIAIVFFKYYSKQKPVKIILPMLRKDEKLIFETMIKHDPGVNQKSIVNESGYSKAKVSKVLKNLQERGLLKLERMGRTNKIYYDEKFKKKE